MTKSTQKILQIKITLREIKPPIWRRVLVSDQMTLWDLHEVIQAVFGWAGYHLHEFRIGNVIYGDPEDSEYLDFLKEDEDLYKLSDFNFNKGSQFMYLYDFGDNWKHAVLIEKVLPYDKNIRFPQFVDGKRATPPEDVGGENGYDKFLKVINNPKHEEHEDALNWIGGSFDPEIFDDSMINYRLEMEAQRINDWNVVKDLFVEDPGDWVDPNLACQQWLKTLQKRDKEAIEALPLRKDVFTLLSYLRDNKVVGTTSTGNFPRKDVIEFAGLMTKNPEIDLRKYGYSSELRNEDEIFPLYFIHLMAYWAKLVEGGKGKRWVLSQKGEQFLKSSPSEQLHALFIGWWFYGIWTDTQRTVQWISYLPVDFPRFIYIILTNIPPNKSMDYGNFLKIIKEALNYHWSEDQESRASSSLGMAIDKIVIDPLEQLGLLVVNRKKIEIEGMTISNKMIDFRLSEFGKEAFRTIMDASFYRELKAKLN